MKKIFFTLALLIPIFTYSQIYKDIVKIEFSTMNNSGYSEKIVITKDSISKSIKKERRGEYKFVLNRKTTCKEWKKIAKALPHIDYKKIEDYKSPTQKRQFDGANFSDFTFFMKNEESYNHSFDNENPNAVFEKLMKAIQLYRK